MAEGPRGLPLRSPGSVAEGLRQAGRGDGRALLIQGAQQQRRLPLRAPLTPSRSPAQLSCRGCCTGTPLFPRAPSFHSTDYTYIYNDLSHPVDFLQAFRTFYQDGLFTDITLQCASDVIFLCHKAVLAACSNYFKAMFTADMKEKSKNQIKLPEVSHTILESLVNYAYTSQIQITEKNVQSLLQAADLLQFVSVKKACEQFLVRHVDTVNCIGMHSFAEYHLCSELEKESRRILLSRFEEVWRQEEFLDISYEKLLFILSRENLNVWKEEAAIEPVVKWIAYDVEKRIECIFDLLNGLKIDLNEIYLRSALSLRKKHQLNENKIRSLIYSALNTNPKYISKRPTAAMYVIGGYYWHPLPEVHVWDPLTNAWIQGTDMPDYTRESYGVTSLGPNIYVTGGYRTDNIEALDIVWIYNSETDQWTEGCPMLNARYYHCAITLGGCVYALGDVPTFYSKPLFFLIYFIANL
uniref:BTB domain-containing protein n=1 Tax=Gopherus evgoodei TaxID=1825980 RepID=A0A8C4YBZ4_9SAUR